MKPMTAREVEAHLRAFGFVRGHGVGSHQGWFNPTTGKTPRKQVASARHSERNFQPSRHPEAPQIADARPSLGSVSTFVSIPHSRTLNETRITSNA